MNYTAKKLGDLSGISVRTLHWYDKIDLLKPSHIGDNGYRYYGRKELYLLQQILFFRELDFGLDEIKNIIHKEDFNQADALKAHKKRLEQQQHRIKTLIETVESTIEDLKGGKKAHDKDLYKGFFSWSDGKGESKVFVGRATEGASESEKTFLESAKDVGQASWSKEEWEKFGAKADRIFSALSSLEQAGESPQSEAVQKLIADHYAYGSTLHQMDKKVYRALADLIQSRPAFRKQVEAYGKDLPEFLSEAMLIWIKN
ncbi:MAG: MerR family transcriptional regulator [Oligoflexales bacterium]